MDWHEAGRKGERQPPGVLPHGVSESRWRWQEANPQGSRETGTGVRLAPPQGSFLWLDGEAPTLEEMQNLVQGRNWHPLLAEEAYFPDRTPRPHLSEFDHALLLILVFWRDGEAADPLPVAAILTADSLITLHPQPIPALEELWTSCAVVPLLQKGSDYMLYQVAENMLEGYFHTVDRLAEELEGIDEDLFQSRPLPALTRRIFTLRRLVMGLRKVVAPERDALAMLIHRDMPLIAEGHDRYFGSLYDEILRVMDSLDALRDNLVGTLDTQLSLTANRTNDTMKVLTVVATIFLPVSLVPAIYGMNFKIPEYHWPFGYEYSLVLMASIAASMLWYFRRKGWF